MRRDQIIRVGFTRDDFSSRGILDVEESIFEIRPHIKLVVNNAAFLAYAADDALKIPLRRTRRRRDVVAHEISCDPARRFPADVFLENPEHDLGLVAIDDL